MADGRWTMDDGRWTMDDGRWTMDDRRWTMAYSYSSASTSDMRTADSAGHKAENSAAARIVGSSMTTRSNGNRYGRYMPERSLPVICSMKYRLAAPKSTPSTSPTRPIATASIQTV